MTVAGSIRKRIRQFNYDEVFSSQAFLDLGTMGSVHQALTRLVKVNDIKRVSPGFYLRQGGGTPNHIQIANAIATRTKEIIVPTDEIACWQLGLTNRSSDTSRFLTTGSTRIFRLCGLKIKFTRTSNGDLVKNAHNLASTAYCAFQFIGSKNITPETISIVRNKVGDDCIYNLLSWRLPAWLEQSLRNEIMVFREGVQ